METYFVLLYKFLNRKMIDFGLPPLIAYPLMLIVFFVLSQYLFAKTTIAVYAYVLLALVIILSNSNRKKNEFLKSIFPQPKYWALRIIENGILSIPFLLFLAYQQQWLWVLLLSITAPLMICFDFKTNRNFTIPTPFGKKPFEFPIGFRKTWLLLLIAYYVCWIAITANNYNLGVFSIIATCFICMSYYNEAEKAYFVWIFRESPSTFLFEKIKTALIYFSLLSTPILVGLCSYFEKNILTLIGFFLLGCAYLSAFVLAKYAAYPRKINIPEGLLITMAIILPPILIGVIPYFYDQSIKNLKPLLLDSN
ncbi:MAG: ABC transporter permease [Bacteroidota bacterium]